LSSESTLKTALYEFIPGEPFDETYLNGEQVKVQKKNKNIFKVLLFFILIVNNQI